MKYYKYSGLLAVVLAGILTLPEPMAFASETEQAPVYEPGVFEEEPSSEPVQEPVFEIDTSMPDTGEIIETEPAETESEELPPESDVSELPSETETTEIPSESELSETETQMTETETQTESEETQTETAETIPGSEEKKDKDKDEGTDDVKDDKEDSVIEQGTIDYVRASTRVPIDGLPGAITQEMVSGALYCQDETGFPASLTLAQIIVESVSDDPGSLTSKAYQTHNLFGLRTGGALKTYQTDTESILDRSGILMNGYRDLLNISSDLDLFVNRFSQRWSSDKDYGASLIRAIDEYQLYRLDSITLEEFESLLPSYVNPCPGTVISSGFGYRELFHSMHEGIDLATGGRHIATYAARGGEVIFAGESGLAGNMICIQHADGTVTDYMHHSEMYVKAGDHVFKGQQIGLAGSTGRSTGIHLHFQINIGGGAVNPAPYLKDDSSGKTIPMESGEREKVAVSRTIVNSMLKNGSAPKREISVLKVQNIGLPIASHSDIIGTHD